MDGQKIRFRAVRWDAETAEKANVVANKAGGTWDFEILANEFELTDLLEWGFEPFEFGLEDEKPEPAEDPEEAPRATLAERFIVPPFSVLDARQGYWQERKRAWLALGIQSELGRGVNIGAIPPNEADMLSASYRANATPGGSLLPAATLGKDGKTVRGDGKGRKIKGKLPAVIGGQPLPLDRMANGKSPARTFGQDLMQGEHAVGGITGGSRLPSALINPVTGKFDRGDLHTGVDETSGSGTSIFDPVLCECAYTWFSPQGGAILDPFAGGSVRGIVAAYLGRKYTGVDLRAEQIEANKAQGKAIVPDNIPVWIAGNSLTDLPDEPVDLIFSCPPYYDLEVYSDEDGDLSNAGTYAEFIADYRAIIAASVARLRDNRFACFVVGDIRSKKGFYQNFVSDTIAAFQDAGATLYNEAILVTAVGSLPIRAGKQFESGRKLGKTHQNVLVFCKGDWKKATQACGPVEVYDMAQEFGEVA